MQDNVINLFFGLCGFCLMILLQALFINGVKECMRKGMIFEGYGVWLKTLQPEWLQKPLGGCVACMSSVFGALTFWPLVVAGFGFRMVEVPLSLVDMFILVYVNQYLYKKL